MNGVQYTIRGISRDLDAQLRQEAERSGKSLNGLVVETLERATLKPRLREELEWFIGSSQLADQESMDDALQWLASLPDDLP